MKLLIIGTSTYFIKMFEVNMVRLHDSFTFEVLSNLFSLFQLQKTLRKVIFYKV